MSEQKCRERLGWREITWEQRLNYLRQKAHEWYSNCPITVEDYDGDKKAYAEEMIQEFSEGYILNEPEERFVRARIRELVGIEE